MDKFSSHTGTILPLRRSNVDTDQIIPAVYLKRITRHGFEDGLFAAWRQDSEFALNRPEFDGATILVAGSDFGTGSSREHAVWALQDYGFKVVISSRFADIFRGNSLKAGLVTLEMSDEVVAELWALATVDPTSRVTVDLVGRQLLFAGRCSPIDIDEYSRWRLIEGADDISLTQRHLDDVTKFEVSRPTWLPQTVAR